MNFDYFYNRDGDRFSFFMLPKVLVTDEAFKGLSSDAKILYSCLLERTNLSYKNKWIDDEKRVYIIFTVEEIMTMLNKSNKTAVKILNELDSNTGGIGLIERKRQGLGKPNIIYVKDFNNDGLFIEPMRLFSGDISTFKIITKNDFVYNSRINSTIKKLSIVINEAEDVIVSPAYESFYIEKDKELLYPFYLYMLLQRESFARKVLFNSFGSSTIVFGFDDLSEIEIPIPSFSEQVAIANLYKIYKERWSINEKLKVQIKSICPILIKGSIEEGRNTKEA
ncbi:replication initiator protein A [Gardnerella vaginalis]